MNYIIRNYFVIIVILFFISCKENDKKYGIKENYQLIYYVDNRHFGVYSRYTIHFNDKDYEPLLRLTYRNSYLDSLDVLYPEGYLGYSIFDLVADSSFFYAMKEKYKIDISRSVYINDSIIFVNGNILKVKSNCKFSNEENCYYYDGDTLMVYIFKPVGEYAPRTSIQKCSKY